MFCCGMWGLYIVGKSYMRMSNLQSSRYWVILRSEILYTMPPGLIKLYDGVPWMNMNMNLNKCNVILWQTIEKLEE